MAILREIGSSLFHSLPQMIEGGIAGAATPNRAHGGATDIAAAAMNGFGLIQKENELARQRKIEEEDRQRKIAEQELQRRRQILADQRAAEGWTLDQQIKQDQLERAQQKQWSVVGGALYDSATGEIRTVPKPPVSMTKIPREVAEAVGLAPKRQVEAALNGTEDIANGSFDAKNVATGEFVDVPDSIADNAIQEYRRMQQAPRGTQPSRPPVPMTTLEPDMAAHFKITEVPTSQYRQYVADFNKAKSTRPKGKAAEPVLTSDEAATLEQNKNNGFQAAAEEYNRYTWPSPEDMQNNREKALQTIRKGLDAEANAWHKIQQDYEKTISKKVKKAVPSFNIRGKAREQRLQSLKTAGIINDRDIQALGGISGGRALAPAPAPAAPAAPAPQTLNPSVYRDRYHY